MSVVQSPNFVEMFIQKAVDENSYMAFGFITSEKLLNIEDFKKNKLLINFNENEISLRIEYPNTFPNAESLDLKTREGYEISLSDLPKLPIWQSYYAPFEAIDKICDIVFIKAQDHKKDNLHRYAFMSVFKIAKNILNNENIKKYSSKEYDYSYYKFLKEDTDFDFSEYVGGGISNFFRSPIWNTTNNEKFAMQACTRINEIKLLNSVQRHLVTKGVYPEYAPSFTKHPYPDYIEFIKEMYKLDPDNFFVTHLQSEDDFYKKEKIAEQAINNIQE